MKGKYVFFSSHPLVFIQPLSKSAGGEAGERGVGNGENWIWGDKGGGGVSRDRVNTDDESPLPFQDEHSKSEIEQRSKS